MRRIGFGEVTRHADLIERTKAEVAGHMLHMSCYVYTSTSLPSTLARTGSKVAVDALAQPIIPLLLAARACT